MSRRPAPILASTPYDPTRVRIVPGVEGHVLPSGEVLTDAALIARLRAEIDALRRLPVIAECSGCGWHRPSNTRKVPDLCAHPRWPFEVRWLPELVLRVPPDVCPLRRGAP